MITDPRGASLLELLVSKAAAGVLFLGLATMMVWVASSNLMEIDRLESESLALKAAYHLRATMAQALNVRATNLNINNFNTPLSSEGRIRSFVGASIAGGLQGQVVTVGLFVRETAPSGAPSPGTLNSNLQGTGIFFQRPSPNRSGVLYIQTSGATPAPDRQDLYFDRLVHFEIVPTQTGPNGQVLSTRVRMIFRNLMTDASDGGWCPTPDIGIVPGCLDLPRRDFEKNLIVESRNNSFPNAAISAGQQTIHGRLYFFQTLAPYTNN
jgi:hypothetical protein